MSLIRQTERVILHRLSRDSKFGLECRPSIEVEALASY